MIIIQILFYSNTLSLFFHTITFIIFNFQVKNSFFYHTHTFICILFYIFPPKANHCPSHKQQFLINLIIPLTVSRNFRYPVFTVIPFFKPWFQNFPVFSVKKFSIAKNSNFILCQNNIWLSWKILIVLSIPVPFIPQCFPQYCFYLRII